MNRRDMQLIAAMVRYFINSRNCETFSWGSKGDFDEDRHVVAAKEIAFLGAATFMLKHELVFGTHFSNLISELKATCEVSDVSQFARKKLWPYLKKIHAIKGVGTMDDYDMTLMSLANLLYLFLHDPEVLPDEIGYDILCQNGDGKGCESDGHSAEWDGMGGYFTFGLKWWYIIHELTGQMGDNVWYRSETENHVAMIYAWNYLASLWILHRGQTSDHPRLSEWYHMGLTWLDDPRSSQYFFDDVLQMLGRPMHSGFFETNSRPYQELTLTTILTLALYGNPFQGRPDHLELDDELLTKIEHVHQAARNAFGYAAATYAFQSLRAKRSAPFRRKRDYRKVKSFYQAERTSVLFGLLSGAHDYDDCIDEDELYTCRLQRFTGVYALHKTFWAAVGRLNERWQGRQGYELPETIQGNMFDKRPYFGIMQARYSREQYPAQIRFIDPPPTYFVDGDPPQANLGESFRGSPELYFGDGDLMLAAGGMKKALAPNNALEAEYIFRARPTMLFPRGDFGHTDDDNNDSPNDLEWSSFKKASEAHVLLMRGIRDEPWDSTCNLWVYGSLAYGYSYDHSVGSDFHLGWAQQYPSHWWEFNPRREFTIGHAKVRIMYFSPGKLGVDAFPPVGSKTEGYYLILIKPRKSAAKYSHKPIFYNYRRGLAELVPGYLFGSVDDLAAELLAWNAPHYFSDESDPDAGKYSYRYVTMTTRERVTLDPGMGWAGWDEWEGCRNGVRRIETLADPSLGPLGSDDDSRWVMTDREATYIPRNIKDDKERRGIPLVRVWELSQQYRRTGRMLMESPEPGRILVRRRVDVDQATSAPVPGWQCLDLDSRDYRKPAYNEYEVTDYRQCGAVPPLFNANAVQHVAAGGAHTCAVTREGKLFCWGSNAAGQLGLGVSLAFATAPRHVQLLPNVHVQSERVAAGQDHSCSQTYDGKVWCWGSNTYGQLGTGNTTDSNAPRRVSGLGAAGQPKARNIATGGIHTCALTSNGRVYCWGSNLFGQLGSNLSVAYSATPVEVLLPARALALAAGGYHGCAVVEGGVLYCWGLNSRGQLGDQTTVIRRSPVQVAFEAVYASVPRTEGLALGQMHTCALLRLSERRAPFLSCFGSNDRLQLGMDFGVADGYVTTPITVTAFDQGDIHPVSLAAGAGHTCVRLDDGSVWCWGDNTSGQLGNGAFGGHTASAVLVDVPFPGVGMSLGQRHSCLVTQVDGALWCFGENGMGQLGVGGMPAPGAHPFPMDATFP